MGKPAPEGLKQYGFHEARDDAAAVASAGPYKSLASYSRQITMPEPHDLILQARRSL